MVRCGGGAAQGGPRQVGHQPAPLGVQRRHRIARGARRARVTWWTCSTTAAAFWREATTTLARRSWCACSRGTPTRPSTTRSGTCGRALPWRAGRGWVRIPPRQPFASSMRNPTACRGRGGPLRGLGRRAGVDPGDRDAQGGVDGAATRYWRRGASLSGATWTCARGGSPNTSGVLFGEAPDGTVIVRENGLRYAVDLLTGTRRAFTWTSGRIGARWRPMPLGRRC